MDYQYDKADDRLIIKFPKISPQEKGSAITSIFPEELKSEIGLLFSANGQLTGLDIKPASRYFEGDKLEGCDKNEVPVMATSGKGFQQITLEQYKELQTKVLFEDPENDNSYGVLDSGAIKYKFGWISGLVPAVQQWLDDKICTVGIDQNFVLFNFETGEVLLTLSLDTYFVDTYIVKHDILVVTQLEIFKIDSSSFKIINTIDLPDFFVRMEVDGDTYRVSCFDGSEVNFT